MIMLSADDAERIQEIHRAFYDAFAAGSLAGMDSVWSHAGHVTCIHPGWRALRGWEAVRRSWEQILGNPSRVGIQVHDVHATLRSGVAWIVCREQLSAPRGARGTVSSIVEATNVFELEADGWRLVHHHGSPVVSG